MNIQLLREDLVLLFELASDRRESEAQEKEHSEVFCGGAIRPEMLATDHPHAICLLEEDGGDGQPVISLSTKNFSSFMKGGGKDFLFLPTRDLVRLASFLHLDLYRGAALVLKGEWERFFSGHCGWRPGVSRKIDCFLRNEAAARRDRDRFNPNSRILFNLFEEHGRQVTKAGYSSGTFDTLVKEMILNDLHLTTNRSAELKEFSRRAFKDMQMAKSATEEEREELWILKSSFFQLHERLAEYLFLVESRRLGNARVEQQMLAVFGEAYIELQEQITRFHNLETRISLKKANPSLTTEELERMVRQQEEERRKMLENQREIAKLKWPQPVHSDGTIFRSCGEELTDGQKRLSEYKRECKKALRELWFLLHPDRLIQDPNYAKLTEKQREHLEHLGRMVLEIKPQELFPPAGYWWGNHRSLEVLQDALEEARAVLKNAGFDINVRLLIQGETLDQQIAWLKTAITRLEQDIEGMRAELRALMEDTDIRDKCAILENLAEHETIRCDMFEGAKKYNRMADELEAQLASLFEDGGR